MPHVAENQTRVQFPIALIHSRFNEEVTHKLLEGAKERLAELGFNDSQITVVEVPGAVEIPQVAARLAKLKHYEAIVALGAVIRGETSHFDYVCQMASSGCQSVALEHGVPVVFGVLTTENEAQAFDRTGGKHGHKGRDAVDTAVEMAALFRQLPHQPV